jgi:hypothetical protein
MDVNVMWNFEPLFFSSWKCGRWHRSLTFCEILNLFFSSSWKHQRRSLTSILPAAGSVDFQHHAVNVDCRSRSSSNAGRFNRPQNCVYFKRNFFQKLSQKRKWALWMRHRLSLSSTLALYQFKTLLADKSGIVELGESQPWSWSTKANPQ